jgi:hypothetical protein
VNYEARGAVQRFFVVIPLSCTHCSYPYSESAILNLKGIWSNLTLQHSKSLVSVISAMV